MFRPLHDSTPGGDMALSPEAIESSEAGVTFTRRSRVRALMAILVLCALAASAGAAVLVPTEDSATNRSSLVMSGRDSREAAAKSATKHGASRRVTAPGEKATSDPC
jgi:hypothetical protein